MLDDDFAFVGAQAGPPPFDPNGSSPTEKDYGDYEKRPTSTRAVGQDSAPAPEPAPMPASVTAPGARRGAGVSLLVAATGTVVGFAAGGLWGAGAGLLMAGALRNAARAKKLWGSADVADREEAASSVTWAIMGGAGGAYLGYRAYQERRL